MSRDALIKVTLDNLSKLSDQKIREVADFSEFLLSKSEDSIWQEKDDVMIQPSILNGLKKASLIRLSKLTTIDKALVIGKFGALEASELKQVNISLIELFDL